MPPVMAAVQAQGYGRSEEARERPEERWQELSHPSSLAEALSCSSHQFARRISYCDCWSFRYRTCYGKPQRKVLISDGGKLARAERL